jgi:lysozyme
MNQSMTYSNNGLALTQHFEGCVLESYQDITGVWTIGYGHTSGVTPGMTCTQEQATQWLSEDVQGAVYAVNTMVTVPLNQNQFDALVDFTFNLGSGNLKSSTLLRLLNAGNYDGAAAQFPLWNHAGGVVVPGLTTRRDAEMKLFNTPMDATVTTPVTTTPTVSTDPLESIEKVVEDLEAAIKQLQDKFSST